MFKKIAVFALLLLFFTNTAFANQLIDATPELNPYLYNITDSKATKIEKIKQNLYEFTRISSGQDTTNDSAASKSKKMYLIRTALTFHSLYGNKVTPYNFPFYANEYYEVVTTAFAEFDKIYNNPNDYSYSLLKSVTLKLADNVKKHAVNQLEKRKQKEKALANYKAKAKKALYDYYKYKIPFTIAM